jgi:hypothetical protein
MMRKLLKRSGIAVLVLLLLLKVPIPTSWADIAATPGSGVNLAYKLIGTANYAASLICDAVLGETQCATVTPQNALKVDNSAVTQPVSAAALPLPAGAATAALQAGVSTAAFQATNTATTAHTCAITGYSELGCLGQVDDDIKAPLAPGTFVVGTAVDGWNITAGTRADAAWTSGSGSEIAILKTIAGNSSSPTGSSSQYPVGALPITASATGSTAATTATLAASVSLKTYICWMSIRANATAAITTNSTVTGTVSGTLNFMQWTAPLASGIGLTEMVFNPCIPSSAINTAINVISAPPGAGGLVSVAAGGYQL